MASSVARLAGPAAVSGLCDVALKATARPPPGRPRRRWQRRRPGPQHERLQAGEGQAAGADQARDRHRGDGHPQGQQDEAGDGALVGGEQGAEAEAAGLVQGEEVGQGAVHQDAEHGAASTATSTNTRWSCPTRRWSVVVIQLRPAGRHGAEHRVLGGGAGGGGDRHASSEGGGPDGGGGWRRGVAVELRRWRARGADGRSRAMLSARSCRTASSGGRPVGADATLHRGPRSGPRLHPPVGDRGTPRRAEPPAPTWSTHTPKGGLIAPGPADRTHPPRPGALTPPKGGLIAQVRRGRTHPA